ncbi:hypothetical protein CBL_13972 [Carabus blaptoides fortunei]
MITTDTEIAIVHDINEKKRKENGRYKIWFINHPIKASLPWVASDRSDFIPRRIEIAGRVRIKARSLLGPTDLPTGYQRDKSLVLLAVELGRERATRLIRPEANGSKKDDH